MSRTPHKHAEALRALADGHEIEGRPAGSVDEWMPMVAFYDHWEYRLKPEREYPVTSMARDELWKIWYDRGSDFDALEAVANAAIRRYIQENEK